MKCINCGTELSNGDSCIKCSSSTNKNVIKELVQQFGDEVLLDPYLFGKIADVMKNSNKPLLKLFRAAIEENIPQNIHKLKDEDPSTRSLRISSLINSFSKTHQNAPETVSYFTDALNFGEFEGIEPLIPISCKFCQWVSEFKTLEEAHTINKCQSCQESLFQICPACRKTIHISALQCSCDYQFPNSEDFKKSIQLVKEAILSQDINTAHEHLEKSFPSNEAEQIEKSELEKELRKIEYEIKVKRIITEVKQYIEVGEWEKVTNKLKKAENICIKELDCDNSISDEILAIKKEIKIKKINKACTLAQTAIKSADLPTAEEQIKVAKEFEAESPDKDIKIPLIAEIEETLGRLKNKIEADKINIENYIAEKKITTAQKDLNTFKTAYPSYSIVDIDEKIDFIESEIKTYKEQLEKAISEDNDFDFNIALEEIKNYWVDFPEEFRSPKSVSGVKIEIDSKNRKNVLKWAIPKGYENAPKDLDIKYFVERKRANNSGLIDRIFKNIEIKSDTLVDTDIEANVEYFYTIITQWSDKETKAPYIKAERNLFCIRAEDLNIDEKRRENAVCVDFNNIPFQAGVEVYRFINKTDKKTESGTLIPGVSKKGMIDADPIIKDENRYYYGIFLKYSQNNDSFLYSEGYYFSAKPSYPPPIVEDVTIEHLLDNKYKIEWQDIGESETSFFRVEYNANEKLLKMKDELSCASLNAEIEYMKMEITKIKDEAGKHTGMFYLPKDNKPYCIFPVSIKNHESAYAGKVIICRLVNESLIKINRFESDYGLTLGSWNDRVEAVKVIYRCDRFSISDDDTDANQQNIRTKSEYLDQNIIPLLLVKDRLSDIYITIYFQLQGSDDFTSICPVKYKYPLEIDLRIKFQLTTPYKKQKSVYLVIEPQFTGKVPTLVVVANLSRQPQNKDDGVIVEEIEEQDMEKDKSVSSCELPFTSLKGNYIGLFKKDDSDMPKLRIVPFAGREQKISK